MLLGEHIGLRSIEPSDLSILLSWRNKPEFRQYFREFRELSSVNQEKWYNEIVLNDRRVHMFSIVSKNDVELLGACGLCYIDWVNGSADFSIYIGKDDLYIDSVIAIDAGKVLLKYAFEEIRLHKVWAEIYEYDVCKAKMFEELGFTLDGRFRHHHWAMGRWHDSLFYSKLISD